ncbi:MAG: ribonuclease P protein component [Dehalococcoidia bacterium]|nr:ribonuclease P protein component [Dehalococcoidia bacterium]
MTEYFRPLTVRDRLTRRRDFEKIQSQGKRWSHSYLVLRALPNGTPSSRFGFAISKQVGTAVVRNRLRRRLRELMRQEPLRSGWDLLVVARPAAAAASFSEVQRAFVQLLSQARLLGPSVAGVPPEKVAP